MIIKLGAVVREFLGKLECFLVLFGVVVPVFLALKCLAELMMFLALPLCWTDQLFLWNVLNVLLTLVHFGV